MESWWRLRFTVTIIASGLKMRVMNLPAKASIEHELRVGRMAQQHPKCVAVQAGRSAVTGSATGFCRQHVHVQLSTHYRHWTS